MEEVHRVDEKITNLEHDVGVNTTVLSRTCIKSGQRVILFSLIGFIIVITIDQAFIGEASCMMDIHHVCQRTNFDSLKVALLFGGFAFFSQLGVAGFLILILYFMMEIKYRVRKVQEILWILTQAEEKEEHHFEGTQIHFIGEEVIDNVFYVLYLLFIITPFLHKLCCSLNAIYTLEQGA